MDTSIKEQFRTYLSNCVQTRRQTGKSFIIGRTAVDSYVSFVEADKLFDYAPDEWKTIDSIFDITSSEKILQVIEKLFSDERFKAKDSGESSQYYRSNALKQYYCFLKARELFINTDNYSISKEIEYEKIPLQQIFYGAPGTGKSHAINEITEQQPKENVFRTTFHPDSDNSTFVGCYKPTKVKTRKQQRMNLSLEDLAKELGSYYSNEDFGKISGIQKFCYEYYPYIDGEYMSVNVTKLLELAGIPKDYNVEINKYVKFCHLFPKQDPTKITYEFVPQFFTKAYIRAWQTEEPVYLVIEEINRGNCAQIFGDLFQLLDRKNGVSEYPIKADNDLALFIAEKLADSTRTDIPELVKNGEELMLPSNLYIWATMNTSDQSLFPIDSAFKRRWDWKYVPIVQGYDKKTGTLLDWKIKVDDKEYDWWKFLQAINRHIGDITHSEDKKLGYFFCKADNGIISADTFVGKVLFYLWNDVYKDYDHSPAFFRNENGQLIEYGEYYSQDTDHNTIPSIKLVQAFIENVEPNFKETPKEEIKDEE